MLHYLNQRSLFGKGHASFSNSSNVEVLLKEKWLKSLKCMPDNKFTLTDPMGVRTPPFACDFCTVPGREDICLVVDEDGYVHVIDTFHGTSGRNTGLIDQWQSHKNAVFDVAWFHQSNQFVTASGDLTAVLWDVLRPQERLQTFTGHSCSVKSISLSKDNTNLFVSGSRDGNALVWDCRISNTNQPVLRIQDAHAIHDALTPQRKRRRKTDYNNQLLLDSRQTVSSVCFQDLNTVITAGAMDGTIKLWDIRKTVPLKSVKGKSCSLPKESIQYSGMSSRRRGYTCLTLDSTRTKLFASCTDNTIYEYDLMEFVSSGSRLPVKKYTGHHSSSFFVRIKLSPDNNFLLSGCDDEMAFIWNISGSKTNDVQPRFCLKSAGMEQVTAVSWCPSDWRKVVTCSDDCSFRVWNVPVSPCANTNAVVEGFCESVVVEKINKQTAMSPVQKSFANEKTCVLQPVLSVQKSQLLLNSENVPSKTEEKRKTPTSIKHWLAHSAALTSKTKAVKKLEEKYQQSNDNKENDGWVLPPTLPVCKNDALGTPPTDTLLIKPIVKTDATPSKTSNWIAELSKRKLANKTNSPNQSRSKQHKSSGLSSSSNSSDINSNPCKRRRSIQSYFSLNL
uniref:denticleless protein homolog isoform X2 n=1 Tax=Ciona intestinalis TaxID=7719 RepID=UPI0002B8D978|nr:denticleless protein homolog isoform X2 [Ciona intestinalis]|eukprot:XP_026691450.1 denticleless protein homolog isoform X2 [Ciona intestinalis]